MWNRNLVCFYRPKICSDVDRRVLNTAIYDKIYFSKILSNRSEFLWIPSPAQRNILLHTGSHRFGRGVNSVIQQRSGICSAHPAVVSIKCFVTVCLVLPGSSLLVEELVSLCFQVSLPGKAVFQHLFSLKNSVLARPRGSESPFRATPEYSAELEAEMSLCSGSRDLLPKIQVEWWIQIPARASQQ